MFCYYWNCLYLGDFLVEGIFQHSRTWSQCFLDHSENPQVWYSKGGAILFRLHTPCLKTYLLFAFYQLGKHRSSLLNVQLLLQNRKYMLCVSIKRSPVAICVSHRQRPSVSLFCRNSSQDNERLRTVDNGKWSMSCQHTVNGVCACFALESAVKLQGCGWSMEKE